MATSSPSEPSTPVVSAAGAVPPGSAGAVPAGAGSATERAAGLTLPPDVLARLKGALPGVATHAVEAIIEEVPSYASAREYLVGNIEEMKAKAAELTKTAKK